MSLVSVCIPTYNDADYIGDMLNSLLSQTYKNIEIIVSDNASEDNTKEIVKNLIRKDKRIKYFRNDQNIGYVRNVVNSVNKASGDFIAIYHSDDYYKEDIIERQIQVLLNSDIGVVFAAKSEFEKIDDIKFLQKDKYKDLINKTDKDFDYIKINIEKYIDLFFHYGTFLPCPSFICRREVIENVGLFTQKYPFSEDLDYWLRILKKGYIIGFIVTPLFGYRRSKTQVTHQVKNNLNLAAKYNVINDFYLENKMLFNKYKKEEYLKFMSKGYVAFGKKLFKCYKFKEGKLALIESKKYYKFPLYTKIGIFQKAYYLIYYIFYKNQKTDSSF